MAEPTQHLLSAVALRRSLVNLSRRFYVLALGFTGAYAAFLLCSRLLGLLPDWYTPVSLLVVPAAASLVAALLFRRVDQKSAARLVDARMRTKDLFLTTMLLAESPGAFQPLVRQQAALEAGRIRPDQVVPFDWTAKTSHVIVALLVLLAATWLPQLDPFGTKEEQDRLANQKQRLAQTVKETAKRAEVLRDAPLTAKVSPPVERDLEQLKQNFNTMKPKQPRENLAKLNEQQKAIGHKWRRASERRLNDASRPGLAQKFGGAERRLTQQWEQDLKAGKTDSVRKELDQIRQMAKELQESSDPVQQQALRSQMQSKLQNLSDFFNSSAASPAMNAALARALEQLQTSGLEGMSSESLAALEQTMDLSELELESLAQSLRDLKALEESLRAIQLAKQLNAQENLDGEACEACEGMGDYIALYQKMMAGQCSACSGAGCAACGGSGVGPGMRGAGIGRGNIAPEDNAQQNTFQPEKSRSAITAGRVLLQWKSREIAESGTAREDYAQALQDVKQGVSEAVLQEQIPPGYHDAIQKYFDSLEKAPAAPEAEP